VLAAASEAGPKYEAIHGGASRPQSGLLPKLYVDRLFRAAWSMPSLTVCLPVVAGDRAVSARSTALTAALT